MVEKSLLELVTKKNKKGIKNWEKQAEQGKIMRIM